MGRKKNANTMCEDLYCLFFSTIQEQYDYYSYALIDEDTYDAIVMSTIQKTSEYIDCIDEDRRRQYFLSDLKFVINYYIKSMMTTDKALAIVSNYLEERIDEVQSYDEALNGLDVLTKFFSDINYTPPVDLIRELVDNNETIHNIFQIITENEEDIIQSENSYMLFNNDLTTSMIESYCIISNILLDNINNGESYYDYTDDEYKNELPDLEPLSLFEENKLLRKANIGDIDARNTLAIMNKEIINHQVDYFSDNLFSDDQKSDLAQEANISLLKAIDSFDLDKGVNFSDYAFLCMQRHHNRFEFGNEFKLVPHCLRNYRIAIKSLRNELGRIPTVDEVACKLNTIPEVIMKFKKISYPLSLEQLIEEENEPSITTKYKVDEEFLKYQVKNFLDNSSLTPIQRLILELYFGLNGNECMSYSEIARKLGVSRQSISCKFETIIAKLKKDDRVKSFAHYMDNPQKCLDDLEQYLENNKSNKKKVKKM